MTENEAKAKLCTWALSQVGYPEGANNWNKYAENPDLQQMYGWKPQNQPWCDTFVDEGFIECFGLENACAMTYQPIGAGSALCRQSAQYYKDAGAWSMRPEIGDQVFFYASGDINHTGIVVGVDGGSVTTVEGNSSDMVAERVYSVGDNSIAGYGRPRWELAADAEDTNVPAKDVIDTNVGDKPAEPVKRTYMLRLPYLQRGDMGSAVMTVQTLLIAARCPVGPDGADGDFGRNTETAVMQYQRNTGLTPDGIIGPATGAVLFGGEIVTKEGRE